jgi:hypothetical protein
MILMRCSGYSAVHSFPEAGGGSRSDGDAALALLLHPVHDSCAIVNFADLVRNARIEKDAFRGRGLPCINMGTDAYVSVSLNRGRACHFINLPYLNQTAWAQANRRQGGHCLLSRPGFPAAHQNR